MIATPLAEHTISTFAPPQLPSAGVYTVWTTTTLAIPYITSTDVTPTHVLSTTSVRPTSTAVALSPSISDPITNIRLSSIVDPGHGRRQFIERFPANEKAFYINLINLENHDVSFHVIVGRNKDLSNNGGLLDIDGGEFISKSVKSNGNAPVIVPRHFLGNIAVGEGGVGRTIIEPAFTDQPFIDISYVDGYNYPVTCSVMNTDYPDTDVNDMPITGCNYDLWSLNPCPNRVPTAGRDICLNPARSLNDGPPTPFFAPCQGAAYTFPHDDRGTQGARSARHMTCCVGTACKAPSRQHPIPTSTY